MWYKGMDLGSTDISSYANYTKYEDVQPRTNSLISLQFSFISLKLISLNKIMTIQWAFIQWWLLFHYYILTAHFLYSVLCSKSVKGFLTSCLHGFVLVGRILMTIKWWCCPSSPVKSVFFLSLLQTMAVSIALWIRI